MKNNFYDVIAAGGGHAGCEAAHAAARTGARTLLLTMNMDHIAQMSCNPAIGGIAKGQVVREIDALGGIMGRAADASAIQFRMLNRKKGPAVWSPRAQCDKVCYQKAVKRELEICPNLDVRQGELMSFIMGNGQIQGIKTQFDDDFLCKAIVLAPGTFMSGKLHYGLSHFAGGRAGDFSSDALPAALKEQLGLKLARLKTGTPSRVLAKTIDFEKMELQEAEKIGRLFGFFHSDVMPRATRKDMPCYMVKSTSRTGEIIRDNIDRSPLYGGKISGIGARYCPSFEDKIMKFPHHETHLLFLEPEGEFTEEYYLNGISTSLPVDVQVEMLRSIPGLERSIISRYAYAIEYDFLPPEQMLRTLQLKKWANILPAGQINGTSGYEEAGGQGLVAGLNAAKIAEGAEPAEFGRENSYIGVMIDDLVTKDIVEPYRLFTSRAEYRLSLRQDNADLRLCQFAKDNRLIDSAKFAEFSEYREKFDIAIKILEAQTPDAKKLKEKFLGFGGIPENIPDGLPLEMLGLKNDPLSKRVLEQIAINVHYEGYIRIEKKEVEKMRSLESEKIPEDLDYSNMKGLRNESRSKLLKIRPTTLAQASRIDGVTPPEIALIQIHLKKMQRKRV
jgi:tRNA uridine 5-carboxymethylaminomethyl modification enzyme